MTATRDPERLIRAFLDEGEEQLHDQIYEAVRAGIEQKRQRAFLGPWRTPIMNKFVAIGLGAAAVVVVGVFLGVRLLGSPDGGTGAGATPSPTVAATQEPTSTPEAFVPEPFTFEGDAPDAPKMTVIIPADGWATSPFFMKGKEVDNVPEAAILTYLEAPGTGFYVFGDPCRYQSTTPATTATTVDEIATALSAQASRDASEPVDVTVGGYAGKALTLHVPDDADFSLCEGPEFATFGTTKDDLARYQQGPGQIDEIYIVDVDGTIVIVDTMYRPNSPASVVDEIHAIVESATFELP